MIHQYDVVVVGGGIAGLYTALTAAVDSCRVAGCEQGTCYTFAFGGCAGWNSCEFGE